MPPTPIQHPAFERRRKAQTQGILADIIEKGLDFADEWMPETYKAIDSADRWMVQEEEVIKDDLDKGVEFVEESSANALSAAKETAKEVFVDAPKSAFKWVWSEVEIPVILIGASAFMAFVAIPLIRAVKGN